MRRRVQSLLVAWCVASGLLSSLAVPSRAEVTISVNLFHEQLAPFGRWGVDARFGEVWYPTHVGVAWRPYTVGHWAYTAEYGWIWVEAEPWGWATYHYGRWFFDPVAGWLWIPGLQWAPAWVSWRTSDDYCGWAPLAPRGYRIDPPHWSFVETRQFLAPRLNRVIVAPVRNGAFFARARGREENEHWHNRAADVASIERATHGQVHPVRVREAETAQPTRVDRARNEVRVVRPRAQQAESRGPREPQRHAVEPARPASAAPPPHAVRQQPERSPQRARLPSQRSPVQRAAQPRDRASEVTTPRHRVKRGDHEPRMAAEPAERRPPQAKPAQHAAPRASAPQSQGHGERAPGAPQGERAHGETHGERAHGEAPSPAPTQ